MANEITAALRLKYVKNGVSDQRTLSATVTVSGNNANGGIQTIGTTEEVIALGDVATPGYCRVLNTDATNYVEIGVKPSGTFYPCIKLKPAEVAVFRFGTTTPYAKANTGSVRIEYMLFED